MNHQISNSISVNLICWVIRLLSDIDFLTVCFNVAFLHVVGVTTVSGTIMRIPGCRSPCFAVYGNLSMNYWFLFPSAGAGHTVQDTQCRTHSAGHTDGGDEIHSQILKYCGCYFFPRYKKGEGVVFIALRCMRHCGGTRLTGQWVLVWVLAWALEWGGSHGITEQINETLFNLNSARIVSAE